MEPLQSNSNIPFSFLHLFTEKDAPKNVQFSLVDIIGDRYIIIIAFIIPLVFLLLLALSEDTKDKKKWLLPVFYMYGIIFFLLVLLVALIRG